MYESESSSVRSSAKISGHSRPSADKFVRRKFQPVAKLLWPKPDAAIATIAKCDPRTARRILRGEQDIPLDVALAAIAEMRKPID